MKDDTVRRLQALECEYTVVAGGAPAESADELAAEFPMLETFRAFETVHGDAA